MNLAADVHDGLYTARKAMPGVLQTRGGGPVAGADGSCPLPPPSLRACCTAPGGARAGTLQSPRA